MTNSYDYQKIAKALGVSVSSLYMARKRGKMPEPTGRAGQSPTWDPAAIEPWIAERLGKTGRKA